MPSHHQKDFFNELKELVCLKVFYFSKQDVRRHKQGWVQPDLASNENFISSVLEIAKAVFYNRKAVHIVTGYGSWKNWLAVFLLILLNCKWCHFSESFSSKNKNIIKKVLIDFYFYMVKLFSIGAIAIGNKAVEQFLEKGISFEKIFKTNYTSNINLKSDIKKIDNNIVRFLVLGEICIRKGVDLVVEASNDFSCGLHSVDFIGYAGQGSDQLLESINKSNSCKYLGAIESNDVDLVMGKYHVLVFPSRYDGWGMSVHEAISNNMPVICSKSAGCAGFLVVNNKNGYLIEPEVDDVIKALRKYIDNPNLIEEHSIQSCIIKEDFSPKETAKSFLRGVHQLILFSQG